MALFFHLLPILTHAADLFDVTIDVTGYTPLKIATANLADIGSYFRDSKIAKWVPGYTGNQPVTVSIGYAGLSLEYRFAQANSSQLILKIPEFGIDKTFAGATRTDSRHLAMEYLKAGGYQTKLAELLISKATVVTAATTASDPVAGNPQSLLAGMTRNDFDQQFMWRTNSPTSDRNEIGAGYRYGTMTEGGGKGSVHAFTPFYRWKFSQRAGEEVTLSAPLAIARFSGSDSYQAGAALAYRLPILQNWTLSAGGGLALVGSSELNRLSRYGGISMTSDLHWDLSEGWRLAVGNMVGRYRTFGILGVNPELSNVVYSNALAISRSIELFGEPLRLDCSLAETRFTGSSLYVSRSQEVGVAISRTTSNRHWRIMGSVTFAEGTTAGSAGLVFSF